MSRDDERRLPTECADETRGNEEVRVDDVGTKAPGGRERSASETDVAPLAAATVVEYRPL
jgi:hypothetical protein